MIDLHVKEIALTTASIATLMPIFENQIKRHLFKKCPKHEKLIKRAWLWCFIISAVVAWWTGIKIINREEDKSAQSEKNMNQVKIENKNA
jgi:hypothetical protein